jgi:hypothetical protein
MRKYMVEARSAILAFGLAVMAAASGCANDVGVDDEQEAAPAAAGEALTSAWQWHSVPDMACGNSQSPTGIGVNPGTTDDVLFYFQGGGACWGPNNQACSSLNGYGAADFKKGADGLNYGVFSRSDTSNPFAKATWVFIPYCTGDLHGGGGNSQWWPSVNGGPGAQWYYRGGLNAAAALNYAQGTLGLKSPSRVTVGGGSAGGYGAVINFWRFRDAYPSIPTYLFDDAGFHFTAEESPGVMAGFKVWQIQYPSDCTTCANQYRDIISYYANHYTTNYQFGFIGHEADDTISSYYYGDASKASLARFRVNEVLMEDWINALPNSKTFVQTYVPLGLGNSNPLAAFFTMVKNANFSHTSTVNYNSLSAYKVVMGGTTMHLNTWLSELVDANRGAAWKSWSVTHDPNPSTPKDIVSITSTGSAKEPAWGGFTVSRTGPTDFPLTVTLSMSGTATYQKDYVLRSHAFLYPTIGTTLTIPAGKTSLSIIIGTLDDRLVEGTETVIANIVPDGSFSIGTGSATFSIIDND